MPPFVPTKKVFAYTNSEPSAEVSSPPGRLADIDVPDELIVTRMIRRGSITDFINAEANDLVETDSLQYVQMPDMSIQVPIEGPCLVWYACLAPVDGMFDISTFSFWGAAVRMLVDEEQVGESIGWFNSPGLILAVKRYDETYQYPFSANVRLEWRRTGTLHDPDRKVTATYRGIMAMLWKR